jgi:tetratricopeptide (TPR) repeat protein
MWVACLVATTPKILALTLPSSFPAGIEETPTAAKDDLDQLQHLERYIRDGKFAEVEPLLRSYLKAHPDSARAYYDLGYALFRTHRISASVEALAKSLQLDINNAEAHKILGLDLAMAGKHDEAQLEMEQAARLKPNSAEIHYFLGRIHYTRNAFPLAKQEFEEAIRLDPSYMKAYDNLGLTMEGMGDDQAALANYEKAIRLMERQGGKSEWPYLNLCAMYNRLNKPELALEHCRKALALNPKSEQAWFEAARAHMAQQDWAGAAKALQTAIEINPRSPKFHYVLSTVYRKMGKAAESESEMASYRRLFEQVKSQRPLDTAERPHPESDSPAGVKH